MWNEFPKAAILIMLTCIFGILAKPIQIVWYSHHKLIPRNAFVKTRYAQGYQLIPSRDLCRIERRNSFNPWHRHKTFPS
jgi:hypothetical protein